jgi:histidinol dehydrogenase
MMQIIEYPQREQWPALTRRPEWAQSNLEEGVRDIIRHVQRNGDEGLRYFTRIFDGVHLQELRVSAEELEAAGKEVADELKAAIDLARQNVERFHRSQWQREEPVETMPGVRCWQRQVPIERVGLYIPGGSAPLFSSLLMLGVPAMLAGCKEIVLCTPPGKDGRVHPAILYTASLLGISQVVKAGGAQAIAGMAFGTESIPRVDKIFGPGNQFVTKAKEMVQQYGVAIDLPAGPSELLVIAGGSCHPAYVAADLLSQAEHGPDSQVVLVADDSRVLEACVAEVERQLQDLPRRDIARQALAHSRALLFEDLESCLAFSNAYAPEHLIIAAEGAEALARAVTNAGSVFLGNYSCESAGDYASGTNHTLPTNGFARSYSGVSLDSFLKKITFQQLTAEGLRAIGPAIEQMAEAEGLWGHKNAVTLRLNNLNNV